METENLIFSSSSHEKHFSRDVSRKEESNRMTEAEIRMLNEEFESRHVGPDAEQVAKMLKYLGFSSLDDLTGAIVPNSIRTREALRLPASKTENETLKELREIAKKNRIFRSYLGLGYHDTITPTVIQRNILENPGWYTQYTPYQAEISQGRLEALLNFQTLIADMTALPVANASLLDEGTAAAEAMAMCFATANRNVEKCFFVSSLCHPQTIAVIQTRAEPLGIRVVTGDHEAFDFAKTPAFGTLIQYPATDGTIKDYAQFISKAHENGSMVVMAADLLGLALLTPPGELGADIAVGSAQRFGVPMGYGGPHAAYMAVKDELKRQIPGRIVGVSKDAAGRPAIRLALQTREQHIRREKATSNICTSQVLLAVMASMYAVYHGPKGVRRIAQRVHTYTVALARMLEKLGAVVCKEPFFDTVKIEVGSGGMTRVLSAAEKNHINLRCYDAKTITVTLDEATTLDDIARLIQVLTGET